MTCIGGSQQAFESQAAKKAYSGHSGSSGSLQAPLGPKSLPRDPVTGSPLRSRAAFSRHHPTKTASGHPRCLWHFDSLRGALQRQEFIYNRASHYRNHGSSIIIIAVSPSTTVVLGLSRAHQQHCEPHLSHNGFHNQLPGRHSAASA